MKIRFASATATVALLTGLCVASLAAPHKIHAPTAAEAAAFVAKAEADLEKQSLFQSHAAWVQATYINTDSNFLVAKAGAEGTEMGMRGEYREVTPPERLVSTESWGGDWPETLNTLTLSEKDGKTTITNTALYPSKQARDKALETGMKEGVSQSFDRLAKYLEELT